MGVDTDGGSVGHGGIGSEALKGLDSMLLGGEELSLVQVTDTTLVSAKVIEISGRGHVDGRTGKEKVDVLEHDELISKRLAKLVNQ
jgi:hypothetical protein